MDKPEDVGLATENLMPWELSGGGSEDPTGKLFSLLESAPRADKSKDEDGAQDPEEDDPEDLDEDDGAGGEGDDDLEEDDRDDLDEEDDGEDDDAGDEEDLDALYERLRKAGYKRRVKVDGETQEVTLDELDGGYSRTSDYTKKTTKLRETERRLESARDQYEQGLTRLDTLLKSHAPKERTAAEWDQLEREDPTAFAVESEKARRHREAQDNLDRERKRIADEKEAEFAGKFKEYADREARSLHEAIPEFADPKIGPVAKRKLVDYLEGVGFTQDDIRGVVDHRLLVLAHKAMKLDAATSKGAKDKIRERREKGRAAVPPAGRRFEGSDAGGGDRRAGRARRKLAERLQKSGHPDDAEALVLDILGAEERAQRRRRR